MREYFRSIFPNETNLLDEKWSKVKDNNKKCIKVSNREKKKNKKQWFNDACINALN